MSCRGEACLAHLPAGVKPCFARADVNRDEAATEASGAGILPATF